MDVNEEIEFYDVDEHAYDGPQVGMGPIRSSICIGPDTSVTHVTDFPDPTCGDIRYPAEITPKVIPAG